MDRRDSKSRRREWLAMLLMAVAAIAAGRAHAVEPGAAAHAHPGARTGDGSAAAQASQREAVGEVLPWKD